MLLTLLCKLKLKQLMPTNLSIQEYNDILSPYAEFVRKYDRYLVFPSYIWSNEESPNATFLNKKIIIVNPYWIKELVLHPQNSIIQMVFYQTLGHEISHTIYRLTPEIYGLKHYFKIRKYSGNFYAWINEIYADFNSIKILFNGNRNKGTECFHYKIKHFQINISLNTKSHPSMKQRLNYIQYYNFNETLIRDIAIYLQYPTEAEILHVISYFPEIILN